MSENEADENVISRVQEVLSGAQSGAIEGVLSVCFMRNGSISMQVAGEQSLIVRLGALQVCADAIKLLETQRQINRQQQNPTWGQSGNA